MYRDAPSQSINFNTTNEHQTSNYKQQLYFYKSEPEDNVLTRLNWGERTLLTVHITDLLGNLSFLNKESRFQSARHTQWTVLQICVFDYLLQELTSGMRTDEWTSKYYAQLIHVYVQWFLCNRRNVKSYVQLKMPPVCTYTMYWVHSATKLCCTFARDSQKKQLISLLFIVVRNVLSLNFCPVHCCL